jgi:general secretion pathway protein G
MNNCMVLKSRRGSRTEPALGRQGGFTLIEMIIVIAIIGILVAVAAPLYTNHLLHARESALKQDLRAMREAIDQYTQDKNKAPQDLNDLVTAGYLRVIPKDPFTDSNTSWVPVQEDVMETLDQTQPGISDVHSGSDRTSPNEGTAYNTW